MVRKLLVIATTVMLALVALPASADSGAIHDAKGDVRNTAPKPRIDYDILKATWGHSNGRLVHTVKVLGKIGHPATGMGALPELLIKTPNFRSGNSGCDYFLSEIPPHVGANTSDKWQYYVQKCSNGPPPAPTGFVHARRLSKHRIRLAFTAKSIGSPSQYGWAFAMPIDTDTPPADRAPDGGMFQQHVLG